MSEEESQGAESGVEATEGAANIEQTKPAISVPDAGSNTADGVVTDAPRPESPYKAAFGSVLPVLIISALVGYAVFLAQQTEKLVVVATAHKASSSTPPTTAGAAPEKVWTITGRVLTAKGLPAAEARVWAIAADSQGRRFSPKGIQTGPDGEFTLGPIPVVLGDTATEEVTRVSVSAIAKKPDTKTGDVDLTVSRAGPVRLVQISPWGLSFVGIIFFGSVLLGLFRTRVNRVFARQVNYYSLVVLSFLLTVTMLITISMGLIYVDEMGRTGEVISLGYANIYQGTYAINVPEEWLFSLTSSPKPDDSSKTPATGATGGATGGATAGAGGATPAKSSGATPGLTRGFGAPLWVLLMAVIGAALFTISLIVKQVKDPVDFGQDSVLDARKEEILRHQFYILFSPIGAIIVYQMMIAAGAATAPVTVALGVLAAGVAVNLLLDKAMKAVQGMMGDQPDKASKVDRPSTAPGPAR